MSEKSEPVEVRLSPDSAALLMLDPQTGIMAGVADIEPNAFRSDVLAPAEVGKLSGLPLIIGEHLPFYGMLAANLHAARKG